jgi:lipopolysaccharide transport system ATP-binding protein
MAVIRFENVSKRFAMARSRPRSFQELLLGVAKGQLRSPSESFWALRDVDFDVARGETVGLVGPNGVGKSTILKLISRIIEPTSGEIRVDGRVGGLLELGAGFHHDLTGRENVYLNGSILGLDREEINRKFDKIVSFAELERFIDVPVKHYSSGMYLRLGFSVAIHTNPDILLVDEVLAVGDAAFQRKCIDKIHSMQSEGVTIILVSHDLNTIQDLCDTSIWLEEGRVAGIGPSERVVAEYLAAVREESARGLRNSGASSSASRWGNRKVEITAVELLDASGEPRVMFTTGEPLVARIHYRAAERVEGPIFGIALYRNDGTHLTGPNTRFSDYEIETLEGEGALEYRMEALPLLRGTYELSATVYDQSCEIPYDHHHRMYSFMVDQGEVRERYGMIYVGSEWRLA